jgi:hypothetical protein
MPAKVETTPALLGLSSVCGKPLSGGLALMFLLIINSEIDD